MDEAWAKEEGCRQRLRHVCRDERERALLQLFECGSSPQSLREWRKAVQRFLGGDIEHHPGPGSHGGARAAALGCMVPGLALEYKQLLRREHVCWQAASQAAADSDLIYWGLRKAEWAHEVHRTRLLRIAGDRPFLPYPDPGVDHDGRELEWNPEAPEAASMEAATAQWSRVFSRRAHTHARLHTARRAHAEVKRMRRTQPSRPRRPPPRSLPLRPPPCRRRRRAARLV